MDKLFESIDFVPFPREQYVHEVYGKKQIVLHHTVSGDGVEGDVAWWLSSPSRIATAFIIARNGTIRQNYGSKYWGYHLGIKRSVFHSFGLQPKSLDKASIGIELDSWGALAESDGKFYPVDRHGKADLRFRPLAEADVVSYGDFRGFKHFERYTEKQLDSMALLVSYLGNKYKIPLTYSDVDMFSQSQRALSGERGIFSHVSYRSDKSDVHPQAELIDRLKSVSYGR